MNRLPIVVVFVLCLAVLSLGAQTPAPAPAPAPSPSPSPAGKWTLTTGVTSGPSAMELKLEDKKVTGTVVGTSGNFEIAGEYADGKLSFSLQYNAQTTVVFTGRFQEDGSLAGTLEYGEGPVSWQAVRVKDSGETEA